MQKYHDEPRQYKGYLKSALTQNPPLTWSLERRCKYVDWTERVIAGCRGVNEGLERRYDEVLHQGRKVFQA